MNAQELLSRIVAALKEKPHSRMELMVRLGYSNTYLTEVMKGPLMRHEIIRIPQESKGRRGRPQFLYALGPNPLS